MKFIFVLLLLGLGQLSHALDPQASQLFFNGNAAYEKGDYDSAIESYQKVLQLGVDSAAIHFNKANAHYRNSSLGLAVFHYRKAYELKPRDAEIKFNLDYVRKKTVDQVEPKASWLSRALQTVDFPVNEAEGYWLFLVCSFILWSSSLLYLWKRVEWVKWMRYVGLVLFLLGGWIAVKHTILEKSFGVVAVEKTSVYSGVGRDNVVLFTLHEGTEFVVLDDTRRDWIQIKLADGKRGWTRCKKVLISTGNSPCESNENSAG